MTDPNVLAGVLDGCSAVTFSVVIRRATTDTLLMFLAAQSTTKARVVCVTTEMAQAR